MNSSGKRRLILDLKEVNKHIWKQSVKYDDIRTALLYVNKNNWCFKVDITSAFNHIDIFPYHRKYLGFSWNFDGITRYFQFNVLPFGLTSAPYIFTKLTRPLIKKWRSEEKTILMYLYDIVSMIKHMKCPDKFIVIWFHQVLYLRPKSLCGYFVIN